MGNYWNWFFSEWNGGNVVMFFGWRGVIDLFLCGNGFGGDWVDWRIGFGWVVIVLDYFFLWYDVREVIVSVGDDGIRGCCCFVWILWIW